MADEFVRDYDIESLGADLLDGAQADAIAALPTGPVKVVESIYREAPIAVLLSYAEYLRLTGNST